MDAIVNDNAEIVTTEPTVVDVSSKIEQMLVTPALAADTTPAIETPDATPATPKVRKARAPRVYDIVKIADTTDGKVSVVLADGTVVGMYDDVKAAWMKALEVKAASATKVKITREKIEGVTHRSGRSKMPFVQLADAANDQLEVIDQNGVSAGMFEDVKSALAKCIELRTTAAAAGEKITIKRIKDSVKSPTVLMTSTDENALNQVKVVLEKVNQATNVVKTDTGFNLVPAAPMKKHEFRTLTAKIEGIQLVLTK